MAEAREHPSPDALAGFLRAEDAPSETSAVRRHLLGGCLPCLLRARDALREIRAPGGEAPQLDPSGDVASWARRVAERAERMVLLVDAERVVAETLASDLLSMPHADRPLAVRRPPEGLERFRLYGLAEHLTREARRQALGEGRRAEDIAEVAVLVVEALDRTLYPPGLAADVQALAWAALGNARRVYGALDPADRALTIAERSLEQGTRDPLNRAEILSLLGSLRIDQAQYEEAYGLLERARSIYRDERVPRLEGKTLMKLGQLLIESGQPARAVEIYERAEELLDPVLDHRLTTLSLHARATALADAGRAEEAAALFHHLRPSYERMHPEGRPRNRLHWLAGKIARGLGDTAQAVSELEAARRGFSDMNAPFDEGVVTLELAALHLEHGQVEEVRRLAGELLNTFATLGIHHHAVQALDLARKTATR